MTYPVHHVPAGDVLPIFFSTYAGATGASVTMTGLAVTDIEIYKDGGATQRASDAGFTLLDTDGTDFDGLTGIHGFSIDTGDNTDAGFYTVGAWFHVVVSSVTVDGQTVNFVAAAFRILPAESVAGAPKVDVSHVAGTSQTAGDIIADTNDIQTRLPAALVSGRIDASVGAMAANVMTAAAAASDLTTEIQSGLATAASIAALDAKIDIIDTTADAILVDTAEIGAAGAGLTALATAANLATVAGYLDTEIAAILADTNELQTDWANGGRLDLILDARASQASVDTIDGIVDSILVNTAEIGAAGAGLTALPWNAAWDAEVQSEVTDALNAYDPPTNAEMEARTLVAASYATAANLATVDTVVDAIQVTTDKLDDMLINSSDGWIYTVAALQDAPSGGGSLTAAAIADAVWEEAIADHSGTSGSTAEALNAAGAAGDPWITALPGSYTAGQAGYILGTNLDAQVSAVPTNAELATALGTADDAILAVLGTPAGASLAADVAAVQADTNDLQSRIPAALISGRIDATVGAMQANVMTAAAAAADLTTELQSGLATASALTTVEGKIDTIDTVVDSILVDTAEIGAAGAGLTALASAANLATVAGYLDTEISAILADTNELQGDWTNGGRLDLLVDAIKAKTDALPASPAATGDIPSAAAIADAVHDEQVDGTTTFRQSTRLANSVLGGKASGLGTTEVTFRDLADTKDRLVATVDGVDGNRTAVTRDLT